MNKANTYLILFPPVSYTLSYLRCGCQVTTFYGLQHGLLIPNLQYGRRCSECMYLFSLNDAPSEII